MFGWPFAPSRSLNTPSDGTREGRHYISFAITRNVVASLAGARRLRHREESGGKPLTQPPAMQNPTNAGNVVAPLAGARRLRHEDQRLTEVMTLMPIGRPSRVP